MGAAWWSVFHAVCREQEANSIAGSRRRFALGDCYCNDIFIGKIVDEFVNHAIPAIEEVSVPARLLLVADRGFIPRLLAKHGIQR